jgi:hypothetical protein
MNRDIQTNEYRFNEARHLHQLLVEGEWKNLTGCTTILGVLAKPALIQWSANMAAEYVKEHWYEREAYTQKNIDEIIAEAKVAHRKKKEKAGDWGTAMHEWVERYIKCQIANDGSTAGEPTEPMQAANSAHFIKWEQDNKVKFIDSERAIYSKSLFLGGIVDILCEIEGEMWICDVKTSSSIYPESMFQCAGYDIMLSAMGLDKPVKGYIILNLKKTGEFEEKRSISNEENKEAFMACLKLYRTMEKLKNQII